VTGKFAGMIWAVAIFATLVAIALIVGIVMNKFLKYEPSNLAIELPELQWPKLSNIFYKMWMRTKDFFVIAVPLLIVGSVIVELAIHYNLLDGIIGPMSWLTVGLLGLPASLIIAFIVGIIRKEMAYAMLIILAGEMSLTEFMTPDQFVVFGVVMAVYMPCLATLTAMFKEIGMKQTAIVSLASIIVAVAVGSAFNLLLSVV
jgi:ferrous iron transport protein B